MPLDKQWAWTFILHGCAKHCMPSEVPRQTTSRCGIQQAHTADSARASCYARLLQHAESLVGNNNRSPILHHITPEARRSSCAGRSEPIHKAHLPTTASPLGLDEREVVTCINEVTRFMRRMSSRCGAQADIRSLASARTTEGSRFVKNLVGFYGHMEGHLVLHRAL